MSTLSIRDVVRNAAAVFSGVYGAVTRQARQAGCSRQSVYDHARQVEWRLRPADPDEERMAKFAKVITRAGTERIPGGRTSPSPIGLADANARLWGPVGAALRARAHRAGSGSAPGARRLRRSGRPSRAPFGLNHSKRAQRPFP